MIRKVNPFIYGRPVPPAYFIGRENIINNCYNRLAGLMRTSIAISGEHGIGKTSLLHYLSHIAEMEQWGQPGSQNLFVYLDCQAIKQFTPTRFWRRVLELLKHTEDKAALHQQIDALLEEPELDATHLQRLLAWLNQQQLSLILLLDSFTWIVKTHTDTPTIISDFLASLRALTNLPDHSLTLLTATREPLNILCADIVKDYPGSYFYNNFAFETLAPFTQNEIDTLLNQALDDSELEFDQADRNFLYRIAGAHPALLQMAGYHLFEAYRHGPLTRETSKKVIKEFEQSARSDFSQFWQESSPLEQTLFVLIILTQVLNQSSLQADLTGDEIQRLLQRYERDLMRLVERGLIQQVADSYQIFSVVFTWWIVHEVADESEAGLADRHKIITEEPLRRAWQTLKNLAPHLTLDELTQALIKRSTKPAAPSIDPIEADLSESQATPPLPSPHDASSAIPPRYELQKEVGRGAFGVVYKAFDTRLKRTVAIKFLHNTLVASSVESRDRLLQEARTASQLQHPYIVTVFDIMETDDYIYLVMEYLEGQTLADLLQEEGPLPLKYAVALIEQAAEALDYAHSQGVLHRDIKPANLIVTTTGGLKLTDFGIAKIIGDPQSRQSTGMKGTILYMSPEQVSEQPLDSRSDLCSLAAVAFEMLSGTSPWPGKNYLELMNSIAGAMPYSLSDFDVPDATSLESIFQKALTKDPAHRYQRGTDFVRALKAAVTK